jgi:hypothetical protein
MGGIKLLLRALTQWIKYLIRCKHREYLSKIESSGPTTKPSYITGNVKTMRLPTMVSQQNQQSLRYSIHPQPVQLLVITQTLWNQRDKFRDNARCWFSSQCLSYLDTLKATGPNGIPSWLLMHQASVNCSTILCILVISHEWKSTNVTPVHKKECIEPAENYRPISLQPILGKVLERCVPPILRPY